MARRFPGVLDPAAACARCRTMCDFDDAVTAPLHGFAGADDYWTRASSKPWLAHVARADARAQRAQRPVRARGVAARHRPTCRADVVLEQPAHGRARGLRDRARRPAASIGCRGGCSPSCVAAASRAVASPHREILHAA